MKDARNAVRNLNGAKIRRKSLKVSFAKYDKNGRQWDDSILQETNKTNELVWRREL